MSGRGKMRLRSKIALGVGVGSVTYLALLSILSWALESRVERRVRAQLAYTLRADDVTVKEVDVRLIRGTVALRGITATRSGLGTASLTIDEVELDIAPLGWAIVDDEAKRLEISGAQLDLSAAGAAGLQRSKLLRQLSVRRFIVHDSRLSLSVTSLFPSLGRVELRVDEARASNVELTNAMSWLYRSDTLDAGLHLPGAVDLVVDYRDGLLSVGGGIMGATPIVIPFSWPVPDPEKLELRQVLSLITVLVKELGPELAKRKVKSIWDDVVDVF